MTNRVRPVIICTESEDCTKQSFKDSCDMNKIVSRINKTGFVPLEAQESFRRQIYGDASGLPVSLEEAYAITRRADNLFSSLPAALRERFGSAEGLLGFMEKPENTEEAITLGLLEKTKPAPISEPKKAASELPAAPAPAPAPAPEVKQ